MKASGNIVAIRDMLRDPVTQTIVEPPLVVASDGYTYALSSICNILKHDPWKRSPITMEVLRPEAYRATWTEEWLVQNRIPGYNDVVLDTDGSTITHELYDVLDTHIDHRQHGRLLSIPMNFISSATCADSIQFVDQARINNGTVHLEVPVYRKPGCLPLIMTPGPIESLNRVGQNLAHASGVDTMFENPEHLLTCYCTEWQMSAEARFMKAINVE